MQVIRIMHGIVWFSYSRLYLQHTSYSRLHLRHTRHHLRWSWYGNARAGSCGCVQHAEYMAALYCNRAAAQVAMGRAQKAFEDCTKSLEFKPHDNLRCVVGHR